jgi:hypothetical protein
MTTLNIFHKTSQGTCGVWYTAIWGSKAECLKIAKQNYSDYLWAWGK